jgi:RNA recognition motif-containing protein
MNERMKTCYKKQYQAETLQEAFEKFGHIEDCHIAKHPDGKSKGFGFVRYSDPRDAEDAMDRMNQKEFEGRAAPGVNPTAAVACCMVSCR